MERKRAGDYPQGLLDQWFGLVVFPGSRHHVRQAGEGLRDFGVPGPECPALDFEGIRACYAPDVVYSDPIFREDGPLLPDQPGRHQGLVALQVHHHVIIGQLELRGRLRQAVRARGVVGSRHQRLVAGGAHCGRDALVVGRHVDARGAALRRALANVDHHGLARQVDERLAGKTRRSVSRRDDDLELQAISSCGGSFLASSSSMTGMPSLTG
jgi:hypothetical protein